MALINNIYVFVESEDVDRGLQVSDHPTENGLDLSTIVRRNLVSLSLSGKIVGDNAATILSKITALHQNGSLVKYQGRNIASNFIITDFSTGHPNTIHGGCSFSMTLREIRIAKASTINGVKSTGVSQVQTNKKSLKVYHTVKKGETAWYLGEKVYKSKGSSCAFITSNNYNVPKVPGDWTTLQIGARLWVYST